MSPDSAEALEVPVAPRSVYEADPLRVVDGDTVHLRPRQIRKVRLLGVNTPELRGGTAESRRLAQEARAFASEWIASRPDLVVDARGMDDLSRELAWVWGRPAGGGWAMLNDAIVLRWPEYAADARVQWVEADFTRRHGRRPRRVAFAPGYLVAHDDGLASGIKMYGLKSVEQAVGKRRVA